MRRMRKAQACGSTGPFNPPAGLPIPRLPRRLQELLAELVKGSLATYINALTYADRTVYPTASTNVQARHGDAALCFKPD